MSKTGRPLSQPTLSGYWAQVKARAELDFDFYHATKHYGSTTQDGLLLWEAFVSGAAKGETHEEDARSGVQAFCEQLPHPGDPTAEETERPFSVLAAATVWAGFDLPTEDIRGGCLVVRATNPPDPSQPPAAD
jgi:hypothetical protein